MPCLVLRKVDFKVHNHGSGKIEEQPLRNCKSYWGLLDKMPFMSTLLLRNRISAYELELLSEWVDAPENTSINNPEQPLKHPF
jgi:hypothetical protein